MNKSVKKCCICNNDKIGEFITIEDKKYHLCCIEQLQENYKAVLKQRDETNKSAVETIEKYQHNWNELKKWLEEEIYNIEPKGTAINYNCEYDSEEDYINAMKERSKLITLKRVLIMLQSLEEGGKNE